MDFADILRRRRMVRSYTDEPVDREAVERILAAGLKAPSGGFSQGARFVAVTDEETRARIAELADEPEYVAMGFEPWISHAPVHIVVLMREDDYHDRYNEPDKKGEGEEEIPWRVPWWWVDAGKAIMLLLLAAIDEGLGAGLFGVVGERNDDVRKLLGAPPDLEVVGVVTVGHRAPDPTDERRKTAIAKRRRPREEVVRWERW
jgi:FMN reductase [NAD(P)H]